MSLLSESRSAGECPAEAAVKLAEEILRTSLDLREPTETARMKRIAGLIENPGAKRFSLLMTDRIGRSADAVQAARMWCELLQAPELRKGFSALDWALLSLGRMASQFYPELVIWAVKKRLRQESKETIVDAADSILTHHIDQRKAEGFEINLNRLGEAVLGEEEAGNRLAAVIRLIEREDVDYVSVKISAIYSQINLIGFDHTLEEVKNRLRRIYRVAASLGKFVNLDMEEYGDLELTVQAFQDLLDEAEFENLRAGIVLQAYLPDSISYQQRLTEWSIDRCNRGGLPIKIRLVKGANLAMEKVDAEIHGWNLATHPSKLETDACFKHMLEYACHPVRAAAVRLGVGSHNLFDVALALILREENDLVEEVEIEMLEGMAPAQSRAVRDVAGGLRLYVPVVRGEDYGSALAYLIRRLDENTSQGNFLASLFSLQPGTPAWDQQRDRFLEAWRYRDRISRIPNRAITGKSQGKTFCNQPDTDWTRKEYREQLKCVASFPELPLEAGTEQVSEMIATAMMVRSSWVALGEPHRAKILRNCAGRLEKSRFETIAALREFGKKAAAQADSEVSEAVDFANYYAETGRAPKGVEVAPLGTIVLATPWNFPFAIPCGGALAALMAGNTVILKPAPEAVEIGWLLVNQLWNAGVPNDVLQFAWCRDGESSRMLIEDSGIDAVVLTGAYETAKRFQEWRPSLQLFAETSGKNAMVVTSMADRELAVKDLVESAFGHSGQKCSAASLAILESEVYQDPIFLRQLKDAAASLVLGDATDDSSEVTPLMQKPGKNLEQALTSLEPGETWLLKPRQLEGDSFLWSPGVKMGIQRDSWFHHTECFGPVLGLMEVTDLGEAIELQNAVGFGLTAGIHSLDDREIATWKNRVQAGNLYINRGITGAIVGRQPFGGWKRSCVGPGAKAGGPNYVNLFRTFVDLDKTGIEAVEESYLKVWNDHFSREHDPCGLRCERNKFRYRPSRGVLLRIGEEDEKAEAMAKLASRITGVRLIISRSRDESESRLVERLQGFKGQIDFIRTLGVGADDKILRSAAQNDINWIDAPMSSIGRLELTRWMREQSVTETRHRYGNLL